MRNTTLIPLSENEQLIIANDNSGAIGTKENDAINIPYDVLAYYSFRVAVMECMAAGGKPISVVLHNFCGEEAWIELVNGVEKGLSELSLKKVLINGSTESNFTLNQSAVGIVVLGKAKLNIRELSFDCMNIAVIGTPLVGTEVVDQNHLIAPFSVFNEVCENDDVQVWPVGSKGILHELNQMNPQWKLDRKHCEANLNIEQSAGPSTCFIIVYPMRLESLIKEMAGTFYHSLKVNI